MTCLTQQISLDCQPLGRPLFQDRLTAQLFIFSVSLVLFCLSTWLYFSASSKVAIVAETSTAGKKSTDDITEEEQLLKAKLEQITNPGPAPFNLNSYRDFREAILHVNPGVCEDVKQYGGANWKSKTLYSPDQEVGVRTGNYSICLDYGVRPSILGCLVYSFGLNNEMTFENGMADYGCNIRGFDPSLSQEQTNFKDKFTGYKIGIVDASPQANTQNRSLFRLKTILQTHNDNNAIIDVLKINTEWRDVQILTDIVSSGLTDHIRQLLVVFNKNDETNIEQFYSQIWVLERLGFVKFAATEWPHPFCVRTNPTTNEKEVHCYVVSLYNSKFYKKYFD